MSEMLAFSALKHVDIFRSHKRLEMDCDRRP